MMDSENYIEDRAKQIRLVIFDVDGVLTNGQLYYSDQGEHIKTFHTLDGLGIKRLLSKGIEVAIISGRQSAAVSHRMNELGVVHVFQGQSDKLPCFSKLLRQLKMKPSQVAYVGDDLPDLPLIQEVGLGVAVANAVESVKQAADLVTQRSGGQGAAREVCDMILAAQECIYL